MTDPDQCIICLETLQAPVAAARVAVEDAKSNLKLEAAGQTTLPIRPGPSEVGFKSIKPEPSIKTESADDNKEDVLTPTEENHFIATLVGCNHVVHDRCIRSWANNSNTCPICRTAFNTVSLSTKIDGPEVNSYTVQDKKQTHEFDLRQWLQDNPQEEPEEETPCPICGTAERPDILLLCDACDAAYHTHCIGLDHVPSGFWYCLECADFVTPNSPGAASDSESRTNLETFLDGARRRPFPRTRERQRRARRQARSVEWQGAWGEVAGRVFDAIDIDIDNGEDDDTLQGFRRSLQQRERELREYQQWERRLQIASRQGARDTFAMSLPRAIGERLEVAPPPEQETAEERQAWNELDRIRESDVSASQNRRKRKTTASPREPTAEEPQRKLKRPRTRRVVRNGDAAASGASGSGAASAASPTSIIIPVNPVSGGTRTDNGTAEHRSADEPSFLSSLLREVEAGTPSDEEPFRNLFSPGPGAEASSPGASPGSSPHNSPRSFSLTPPPMARPTSPGGLSTHIEPIFPKANYLANRNSGNRSSGNRSSGENSDSEGRPRGGAPEIRQPRPRRPGRAQASSTHSPTHSPTHSSTHSPTHSPIHSPTHSPTNSRRASDTSPSKPDLGLQAKERINAIVLDVLRPHWRAHKLTPEQYSNINRDVSRSLYESIHDAATLNDDLMKRNWERIATREVALAMAKLAV